MQVVIDSREHKRVKSATKYFTELGYTVTVSTLDTGDFVFNNKVAFEYKTIPDFISSINDGRVFNECIDQSEQYPYHFCIIQGTNYDLKRALEYAPRVTIGHYYGAISRLNTYTTVINVYGATSKAYDMMHIQTSKCLDNTGKLKHFPIKSYNSAFNVLCYCIRGISKVRAEEIVSTCDIETVADVFKLTTADLIQVDGIGEKLADQILTRRGEL